MRERAISNVDTRATTECIVRQVMNNGMERMTFPRGNARRNAAGAQPRRFFIVAKRHEVKSAQLVWNTIGTVGGYNGKLSSPICTMC